METSPRKKAASEIDNSSQTPKFPTVIFVDDEEPILQCLRSLFRHEGYNTHFFTNGDDALDFIEKNDVDVIVTDMRMPEISGLEFLQRSLRLRSGTIRIILSGYEDKEIILTALARGIAHHFVFKPWEDKKLKELVAHSITLRHEDDSLQIQHVIDSLPHIPTPPRIHLQFRKILSDPHMNLDMIVQEVEKNPSLVAKLLRVSNSVFYSSRKHITSIHDAIVFIGTEYVAESVLAIEAFESFGVKFDVGDAKYAESLWDEAICRAILARKITREWQKGMDSQPIYISALLQDIGLMARLVTQPEKYKTIPDIAAREKCSFFEADKKVFHITHDKIGPAILNLWNFPPEIVIPVSRHHSDTDGDIPSQILQISDALLSKEHNHTHDADVDALIEQWREKISN